LILIITAALVVLVVGPVSSQAQIWTEDYQGDNVTDFAPAENVYIRGSGFNSNAQIDISITRPDNAVGNYSTSSDENGCFLYIYTLDGIQGTYFITATDGVNSASDNFDDCLYHLEGYDKTAARWERGLLEGWNELDWVPYRILFSSLPKGTLNFNFNVYHNNLLQSKLGVDQLMNFRVGDVNGNPVNGTVTASGPFYKTPGKSSDRDVYYSLSVTFNTPSSGKNWYVYWDAHLALGSSGWPGAKLHAYADITGTQTVPIKVPPVPSGSISGAKWNDQSYNGIWDPGENGLSGWTIQLYFFNPCDNKWINIDNENTGAWGSYKFSGLVAGNYRVNEVLRTGWIQTFPISPGIYNITLSGGENRTGINFGNVLATLGVSVSISPSYENGLNKATLTYTVTATNTGNISDTFYLTPTDNAGWSPNVSPTSLTLPPGSSENATLSVTIPENAVGGTKDNLKVTATDNGVSSSATCIAQVTSVRGVNVSISPPTQSGANGATLTYTVIVTNTGNISDTYSLTASDNSGWSPNVSPTPITVPPFNSGTTTLSVTVPSNAVGGTIDNVTVTATDNGVSSSSSCTAQATIVRGVQVMINPSSQENMNGGMLAYIVTVKNTGNVQENFQLTKGDNTGWALALDNAWLLVPRGENRTTKLTVTIPVNTMDYTCDNIWVKATSKDNAAVFDNKSCLAHVRAVRNVDVSVSPSYQSGPPESTLNYVVTVRNSGSVSDTYALTGSDNENWGPTITPSSLTIAPGASDNATLSVVIPKKTWAYKKANVVATAKSTENAQVSASGIGVANTDVVRGVDVSISPGENEALPGENTTYVVTITNTGNVEDTYDITVSNNAGWNVLFSLTQVHLSPYGSAVVSLLIVTVSENAVPGTTSSTTVTAISETDPMVMDNDSCVARAEIVRGVNVSFTKNFQENENGGTLTYTVMIANTGNVPDNYALENTDKLGWGLSLSTSLLQNIENGTSKIVMLTVAIPNNAWGRTLDNITVTATCQENENVSNSGTCLASVKVLPGVDVRIEPGWQENFFGDDLTYTVTVINTGNVPDNYTLTPQDIARWGLTLSDNLVNDNVIENLKPGENRTITLTVTILDYADFCKLDDTITVTATSMENTNISDNSSCTGHGISWTGTVALWLENVYKVGLTKDLQFYAGRNFVVKFYKYDSIFQAEIVIHSFTPRENITENENVPQPRGAEGFSWGTVQIARLVLTTNNTADEISTIASWTTHQSDLRTRYGTILRAWGSQPETQPAFRTEIGDILRQWSSAPP
jgi:uncharacterized repeat protein (TIGR01451 family)